MHHFEMRHRIGSQSRAWHPVPNAMEEKILRLTLAELGHEQPPTPIYVDNTEAVGIVNSTIKCQRSRATNMRYF